MIMQVNEKSQPVAQRQRLQRLVTCPACGLAWVLIHSLWVPISGQLLCNWQKWVSCFTYLSLTSFICEMG